MILALGFVCPAAAQVAQPNFPVTDDAVTSTAISGNTLYLGGWFTRIGPREGPAVLRNGVAAVDVTTGSILPWNPTTSGYIFAATGGTVYLGGPGLMAVDGVTGLQKWALSANNSGIYAMAMANGLIYVGGSFTTIGGVARSGLAAIDPATGAVTAWNPPGSNGLIWCLVPGPGVLYAGGDFTSIGGQPRNYIAALSQETGLATAWNPGADRRVYSLVPSGSVVYAAGEFGRVGGQYRRGLAAIDASTGAVTSWNPSTNGDVWTMALSGNTLYVGGVFTTVGTSSRNGAAEIHAETGATTAWSPDAYGAESIALGSNAVFLGGQFVDGIAKVSSVVTGIEPTPSVESVLGPAAPNPFGASTSIRFSLEKEEAVSLRVYNVHGREIAVLAQGKHGVGTHVVGWDGTDRDGQAAVSGVYFYELKTTTLSFKRKVVLVR
ncbi:MAG TPA: FlgD immunoglobulin-like domain containing protein [Candidatus Eisenbacteria bacterium]|nr:FlgD immunoglobulin-like domain containing protein [Candidatus Eisenbacteria bacterium]